MKKPVILTFGVAIGCTVTLATNVVWGLPKNTDIFRSKEPVKTVQTYLQQQSTGNYDKAQKQLTGEALQMVMHQQNRLRVDPLVRADYSIIAEGDTFAQVEAYVTTGADSIVEDFYLTKQTNEWKIFSIQLPSTEWKSFSDVKLDAEQTNAIKSYTASLASGDVESALQWLVGPARIRASEMNVTKQMPSQQIEVESEKGVGKADVGELVEVKEKVRGITTNEIKLIYTLASVDGKWKIYDIRTISSM